MPEPDHTTGSVHDTHPGTRSYGKGQCYSRGYHLGQFNDAGLAGDCLDCGSQATPGGLLFHNVATEPGRRKVHAEVPDVLTHKPLGVATEADLLAARGTPVKEQVAAMGAPAPVTEISRDQADIIGKAYLGFWKTRENVIQACKDLGIHLVDSEGISGVNVNLDAKMKVAEDRAAALSAKVFALADQLSVASDQLQRASDRISELEAAAAPAAPAQEAENV